ncbi:MAG TPA: ATP-binding protein [Kofleriaceae bacterium]|nr:ATP-binding protein [Kofleriaceae bacterium]
MRLTAKLTAALLVAICAVALVYGDIEVRRQTAAFEAQLEESQRTVGRLFRPMLARTWRNEGELSALYLVQFTRQMLREESVESKFDLRWVWLDDAASARRLPLVALPALAAVATNQELTVTTRAPDGSARLVSYVPLPVTPADGRRGALEISSSLQPVRAYTAASRARLLATLAVGIAVLAGLSALIGMWLVGRPVRRLAEVARQIGAGDLSARPGVRQRDELGYLAREMTRMANQLTAANTRVAKETRAKLQAIEHMRHADRLATIGKLASGVAHELGTPLAVVSGRAQLLAEGKVSTTEVIPFAASIKKQADRMAAIIRQLMDFARHAGGERSPLDLTKLVRDAANMLRTLAKESRVDIDVEAHGRPVIAPVDASQFQQVLSNLVVNAIHAMPDGGTITMSISRERAMPPGESDQRWYACVRVRDDGVGIPAEIGEHIFEPFFTTKEPGEGSGLGLAVSHGIIADHDGWIEATSKPGQGTCFSVYVPTEIDQPIG